VSPQAPVTDWFIHDFHHNGAFFQMDDAYPTFGASRQLCPQWITALVSNRHRAIYKFFMQNGTPAQLARLMGDSIKVLERFICAS
jgi:hypothetical protein